MTQLSILGPPRGGRRVKSEEEFLEEVRSWQESSKSDPDLLPVDSSSPRKTRKPRSKPQPVVTSTSSVAPSYFVAPGRFNVGGITTKGEGLGYVFHDLELPMGSWKELTLFDKFLLGGPKSFDDWSEVTGLSQPVGVIPADIRYGLMVVCYLNKGKLSVKNMVQMVRHCIWLPEYRTHAPHNSTLIEYRANAPAIISPGVGWPMSHPLGVQYEANISGQDFLIGKAGILGDPSAQSALEGLLGENDPERCRTVLRWGMGAGPLKFWRLGQDASVKKSVIFGKGLVDGDSGINTKSFGGYYERPARAIRADKQNYIRK